MTTSSLEDLTQLLQDWHDGRKDALDDLLVAVYQELRQLAQHNLRGERSDHTLQTTALVHEAYLRLLDQQGVAWQSRAHFFGIASRLMRRILVDYARRRRSAKRDGGARVPLEDDLVAVEDPADLELLDRALVDLEALDPKQARLIELRFFGGLTIAQAAEALGVSPATAKREWRVAKAWLARQLGAGER